MATQAICNDGLIVEQPGIVGPTGVMGSTANMWQGTGLITATSQTSASLTITDIYKQGNRWSTSPDWELARTDYGNVMGITLKNFLLAPVAFSLFVETKQTGPLSHILPSPSNWMVLKSGEVSSDLIDLQLLTTSHQVFPDEVPTGLYTFYNSGWRTLEFSYLLIGLDE